MLDKNFRSPLVYTVRGRNILTNTHSLTLTTIMNRPSGMHSGRKNFRPVIRLVYKFSTDASHNDIEGGSEGVFRGG